MESKYGFLKMSLPEFENWLNSQRIARTILYVQQHHTWVPNYSHFNGSNHFERQLAMKNHHVGSNGWSDIGQHFTIFPDGMILTGRSLESTPACIYGNNQHSICFEHLGNFDIGGDQMTNEQRQAIIKTTALICQKFNLPVNPINIIYHHWFELGTGRRNDGSGNNKSCPGTNFFDGNKVQDFNQNFAPLVLQELTGQTLPPVPSDLRYGVVTANLLNVRVAPTGSASKASDRNPVARGAVLRIYDEVNNWLKISKSQSHWVYNRYVEEVKRATVNASVLRVRSGPGTSYSIVGNLPKSEEVFISEESNGWCKLALEEKWLSRQYLDFAG
ncbi:amidase [Algoriphagus kandeliae]|uniref:Amidase n=1 Tax=Algoriphagus kandeliae TaxID=2562278 RepID=A0A4Y9R0H4_9BACT|nr:SH3 domain-containing protein [Algoriphagus kandeliae]TFV97302.1 amidase [Algoriphagus kandeliae]